jgi:hypothetical protein
MTSCYLFTILAMLPSQYGDRVYSVQNRDTNVIENLELRLEMKSGQEVRICRAEWYRQDDESSNTEKTDRN